MQDKMVEPTACTLHVQKLQARRESNRTRRAEELSFGTFES
jgi:hypothetical protein